MKSSHRPSRVSPGVALAFLGLVLVSLSTASAVTMQITALLAQGVNTDAVTYGSALTLPFTKGYGGVSFQPTVSTVTTTNVIDVYSTISTEVSAAAIVGPTSTDLLITIEQDGYAGVAQFAPFVESINWYTTEYATSFEAYYRFSYLTNPPASIQALAGILAIFKGNLLPKTIGAFTASQNLGFGSKAQEILSQVVPLVTGKALVSYSPATFQQNDFTTFIGNNMGGVLIFADRTDTKTVGSGTVATSTSFLQAYAGSAAIKAQNTTTMLPFENQFMALSTFTGTGLDVRAVISTAPVPGVAATSYAAVQQFNSVKPGGMTNTLANFAMAGWVGGQVLMQSVFQSGMSTGYTDITTMQAVMLNSYTSYSVYDMYLGMYSPQCAATGTQSAYCSCHQLGNNVYMHRMNSNQGVVDFYPDPANDLLQVSVCPTINGANYFNAGTVTMPIHSVSLGMQDVANSPLICSNYFNAVLAISNPTLFAHASSHPYRSYCLTTNSGSAAADLTNLATNNIFSLLVGMIPDAFMQSTTYTVLDPLPVTTQLPSNLPNLIHLFSTVQQEVYQLTAYLSNIGVNSVCALVQESPSSTVLLEEIYRGLYAYGLVDAATGFNGAVKANQNLIPNIPGGCEAVFLIGITATDAAQLGSYLNSHSNMRVLLPFDDVTKYYTNILSTVSGGAASRLIFATNVPSWVNANNGGASSGFSTVSQFLSTIPVNLQTPATVRSYIAAMVIDQLTVNDAPLTVPTIAYQVYNRVYFSAAGVNFGPYNSVCTLENNMVGASCLHNYGARDLSVWTFDNVLQKSQPVNYGIPSLYYKMTVVVVSSSSSSSSSSKPTCVWLDGESKSGSASLPPMPDNAKKTLTALLVIIALLVCAAIVALIVLILYRRGFFKYNPRKAHLRMIRSMEESQEEKAAAYTATHNLFSAPGLNSEQLAGVGGAGMGGGARDPVAALLTGGGDGGFGGGYGSELGHSASYGGSALGGTVMATFVVVDIESSTPLWAAVPEVMAQATICYQKVVRDAVAAHHGYEAQLVGDVFLIACEQAMNAVEIGRDIQVQLPKKMPANVANAIREAYEVVGRPQGSPGLRLRIGIHTGYASVSLDRQTQQCTYTGETRDTAVRTASLCPSGQVFLTERTTGAMSPPDLATLSLVSVGFHSLGASGAAEQRMLEVFELEFPNSVSSAGNVSAPMDAVHALYMLQTSDEWAYVSVIEVANQVIEAHLRDYTTDSAILTMSRCGHNFGLNIPPADRFRSKEEYVESLRDASSQRVASIMECINGARDAGGELEGANATVTTVVTRGPTVVAGNFSRVNRLRQRAPQPQGFTGTMRSNRWSANSSFVGNNSGRDRISTPEKPNPPMRSMNWNEGAEGEDSQRHRSYNNNANSPNGTFLREARNPQQHFDVTNGSSEAPPTRSGQRGATSPDTNRNPLSVQNSNVASHRNNGNYGADADDLSNSPRGLQRQLSRRNGN